MAVLKIEGVTHWSIPVNDLNEAEEFYGDLLGLTPKAGWATTSCPVSTSATITFYCANAPSPVDGPMAEDAGVHHSFTVSPETFNEACRVFRQRGICIDNLTYRGQGFFTGRELYFFDPSGNRLELRDPTWSQGMPEPRFEELANA